MNIDDIMAEFLNNEKHDNYKAHINNFKKYITEKLEQEFSSFSLKALRTSDIIESMRYLIQEGYCDAKSYAKTYFTVVSKFYRYLIENDIITNNDIFKAAVL
jgi:site-specific recombinase XerD